LRKFPKPCLVCGKLSLERLCPLHLEAEKQEHEEIRRVAKAITSQYKGSYSKRAKAVRENAVICHLCGQGKKIEDPFEADHINPAENGNTAELLPAHRSCNRKRSNKPLK
jgi:5-methylcytosine-specific restriction endonuclease McrA